MLKYQIHECYDEDMDFLDALRQCDAGNFTADAKTEDALADLKDDLHRLDDALEKIIAANPGHADKYREQHRQAEAEISKQIMKLGLHDVRVA